MLPPGNPNRASTPEARLRSYSHQLWDQLSADLADRTGIDNGYRRCGAVELGVGLPLDGGPARQSESHAATDKAEGRSDGPLETWQHECLSLQPLNRTQLERHVPGLHPDHQQGVYLPDFGQVRNPRHLKALAMACRNAGVEIVEGCETVRLHDDGRGRAVVESADRRFQCDRVCLTAGAWTSELLQPLRLSIPVTPMRGQMVQLKVEQLPFRCVIEQGLRYLVPRADGLILVGSTMEATGFEKKTTAQEVAGLIQFAQSLVPELGRAELVRCWAGLRPASPEELPYLGQVPGFENLMVAAGHFRSGLQMSPGTGAIMADLLLDRTPAIDLTGLEFARCVTPHENAG